MALTTYLSLSLTAGSVHAKGAYTEIVASTPYASSRLILLFHNGATKESYLLDLATGPAASESVVVANVAVKTDADVIIGYGIALDVDIPAGTRLAGRCQSSSASAALAISVLLENRTLGSLSAPVTYGATPTFSRGTSVDPGTTISTKGSYVEVSASTSARIDAVTLCLTATAISTTAYTAWNVDVATGAAGMETVVIPNVRCDASTAGDTVRPGMVRVPVSIPAGTRLAVRCDCNRNTAVERVLAVTVIGLQEPASGGEAAGAVAYVG